MTNTRKYIHIAIMFILTIGIGILPPFGQMTEYGMHILGVFIGVVYGWIFVNLTWASLFGFIALPLVGYGTVSSVLIEALGNASIVLMIAVCAFAASLEKLGVNDAIAYWLLSRKFLINKPWALIIALIVLAYVLGCLGGGFAAIFLLWSVINKIATLGGYEKGNSFRGLLIAIVVYAVVMGGNFAPWQYSYNLYQQFWGGSLGLVAPAAPTFLLSTVYTIACLILLVLICKVVFKFDVSAFTTTKELAEEYSKHKTNIHQKVGLVLLAVYLCAVFLPSILPGVPFFSFLGTTIGIAGCSIVYILVFAGWKKEDGKTVLNLEECFKDGVIWQVVLLMGLTFPLSAAIESAEVGFTATVAQYLLPVMQTLGPTALIVICAVLFSIATQFLHNLVLGAIFFPILTPIIVQIGGNPYTFFWAMLIVFTAAFVTPAGCAMAGMVFGADEIKQRDSYIFGLVECLITIVLVIALLPVCNILL